MTIFREWSYDLTTKGKTHGNLSTKRWRDAGSPASRGWAWYAVATGLLVVASDIVFVLTFKVLGEGPIGLIARIGIMVSGCWVALLAIRLMRKKGSIA